MTVFASMISPEARIPSGPAKLVAGGLPAHFLQELPHRIELRAETFPISGFQSLDCPIIAIEAPPAPGLPRPDLRRALPLSHVKMPAQRRVR